jgi:hypothetical protein
VWSLRAGIHSTVLQLIVRDLTGVDPVLGVRELLYCVRIGDIIHLYCSPFGDWLRELCPFEDR